MEITYASSSFQGCRDCNEDYLTSAQDGDRYCFVIADGLGGHGRGEVASKLVCEEGMQCFQEKGANALADMFTLSQECLLEKQKAENATDAMKTTMNILTIDEKSIHWGHIGDTRTYYFRKAKLVSRTKDHSVPQMMVSMGEIKEKDIRHHVDRNRLLRVMGIEWPKPQYAIEEDIKIQRGQAFLMCTDGFWEYIEEKDMEKCLKKAKDVQGWLDAMNEVVRQNGEGQDMDNYTALAVWIR